MSDGGLAVRLAEVRERISTAAARAGRSPDDILLLAVTKVFPASVIRDAYELGLRDFGENYVQEFEGKAPLLRDLPEARFHLIGHLQSNKSRKALELFQVIQTVDSPRLAGRLNESATPVEVYLEVKLSTEESKHGALPEKLAELVESVRGCPRLKLAGLMTIPPWTEEAAQSRPYFNTLRELAERVNLTGLSMGMSHDFEVAIEEGATCIRVGTALFGKRRKP